MEEETSDDNRSSSLGRSAPSDDASDYQDEVSECKFTAVLILDLAPWLCVWVTARKSFFFITVQRSDLKYNYTVATAN